MQVGGRVARDADVLNLFDPDTGGVEAVANGLGGKSRAMLDPVESFLFNRGEQLSVFDERSRRVTVICVYSENVHK